MSEIGRYQRIWLLEVKAKNRKLWEPTGAEWHYTSAHLRHECAKLNKLNVDGKLQYRVRRYRPEKP